MHRSPAFDEFPSITESSPLVDELAERIAASGPVTFRDFMEAALYHARYGYYTTDAGVTGRGGDYVTSPELHPIFGTLVAKQLHELWLTLDRPATFTISEAGAGRGLLARDILRATRREPDFRDAVRYRICETIPMLKEAQCNTLAEAAIELEQVRWHGDLPAEVVDGCVLTNELLDAFPVHRVVREDDALHEVYVAFDGTRFRDELGPLSDERIRAYFDELGLLPGQGCTAEVGLDAEAWYARAARSLRRGYILTFDYGYEAPDLYTPWRRDGTLLCFYRQSAGSDPYQRIGRQDITASVDFTKIRRAGEDAGLETAGFTDQTAFLTRLGIGRGVAAIAADDSPQIEEYFARRQVVLDLLDPAKLGRIKVLLQGTATPRWPLSGFTDA